MSIKIINDIFRKYGFLEGMFMSSVLAIELINQNTKWLRLKKQGYLIKQVGNNKMYLDLTQVKLDIKCTTLVKQIAVYGTKEEECTKLLKSLLKDSDIVLDIGANIGYYVLIEAEICHNGQIYGVEPEVNNYKSLYRNVSEFNEFTNVQLFNFAMSDENGKARLKISNAPNKHFLSEKGIEVETVTVDSLFKNKLCPDFIRMDVEGAEFKILRGAREILESSKNLKMFIEVHPTQLLRNFNTDVIYLFQLLKKYNFEIIKVIIHDTQLRKLVGFTEIIDITLDELMQNKKLLKTDLQLFVEKKEVKDETVNNNACL